MSKELEKVNEIHNRAIYKADGTTVIESGWFNLLIAYAKQALLRLESIDNSNTSEALECLERIGNDYFLGSKDCTVKKIYEKEYNTIKQVLIERIVWKNIHNTKVKTPLVSIFEGLSKDERFKFTEHIYYHWEEMKEALEDKNNELEKENVELKAKAQKEHKALEIISKKNVDMLLIKKYDNVSDYNSAVWLSGRDKLTEEEFNTLKKEIKNDINM